MLVFFVSNGHAQPLTWETRKIVYLCRSVSKFTGAFLRAEYHPKYINKNKK